jgi:hypothetical protein
MSWRRGELWLDTDVLWFREGTGASAVAGFAPAPLPSMGPPPGLAASRQRRTAWRRRRYARRARTTALVLSPAVIFPLALLRNGGGEASRVVLEDPPSLTFRLGSGIADVTGAPDRVSPAQPAVERSAPAAATPSPVHPTAERAETPAAIEWHHAASVGLPYNGSLFHGTQLPIEGPDWVTWNPVTDSVPNAASRVYGNDRTIRAIVSVTGAYRAANPSAPRVLVGDISRPGGGPMTDEHVSHQNGLDVDIYFPRVDGTLRAPVAPGDIDHRLAQDLLDRFVAAGAQMVFVGYSTGLHGAAGVVIPYAGHENHMHVRFPPPGG